MSKPYVIGVCGASCSGKTTTVDALAKSIKDIGETVTVFSQDSYYKEKGSKDTNFDKPDALDWVLFLKHLNMLIGGESVDSPVYNFSDHSRDPNKTKRIDSSRVIIVEGILIFTQEEVLKKLDLKIFVSSFNELCYARRINRDINERGRDISEVTDRYCKHVFPSIREYVEPSEKHADLVLKNNVEGRFIGLQILIDHVTAVLMD